jgi:hypothetical protein
MKLVMASLICVAAAIFCGQATVPATMPASSPATSATASATAPEKSAALATPESALHEFLIGMMIGDEARLKRASLEVEGREILLPKEKLPETAIPQLDKMIEGLQLKPLKIGDSIKVKTTSSPEGVTVVMDENRINDSRAEITGPSFPYPFILVKGEAGWKVDPTPLIASRKAAQAARAATQTAPATRP